MRERILAYIRRYHMVEEGDRVCVGLSGGADSLCLLVILQELSEELGIRLQAVHVNHGLRGEESDQDQAFTERLCREREIPLFVYARRVGEIARELGVGTEEAGRLVRQQIYLQCMQEHGSTKIALAHHQNDLAETLLFHLARGTSLRGLGAIRPVSGFLIRPLLCVSRGELEQELRSRGMTWRTDSTNLQDQYTRNCIRHHLIPSLVDEVNAQAVAHMAQAAGIWPRRMTSCGRKPADGCRSWFGRKREESACLRTFASFRTSCRVIWWWNAWKGWRAAGRT